LQLEGPVVKSIPYVQNKLYGVADYYATSVFDGFDFANLLVKTREVVLSKLTIILSQELDFP
jgi:hypothetical protein